MTPVERTEVLVIGGGQAGIAASAHLGRAGVAHLVLERARIAESWRSRRWDSLVANGPAWHDRFPDRMFDVPPDDFAGKDSVAAYLEAFAAEEGAPIRTGTDVTSVARREGRPGFFVQTSAGPVEAAYVIVATGPFQVPKVPGMVPAGAGFTQLHSAEYRNPAALPEGGILVVGGGSSGVQIADELARAGRRVVLSVGPHGRPPRAYRGRDYCWWLGVLNQWDAEATPGVRHVTIAVSGARGGRTIDFRALAAEGITLVGRAEAYAEGTMRFANDLSQNIARGDANYLKVLDQADAFAARNGLDLPLEPQARQFPPDPPCLTDPIQALDLRAEGISTILWATGYTADYTMLNGTDAVDAEGRPAHLRGISDEPGIYFLGLPWQTRRASSFIYGVWHDASYIADHILKRRAYLAYPGAPD